MRFSFRFLLMLVPAVVVVVLAFVTVLDRLEQKWVLHELNERSRLLAENLQESFLANQSLQHPAALTRVLQRTAKASHFADIAVCTPAGKMLASKGISETMSGCAQAPVLATKGGNSVSVEGDTLYRNVFPLLDDKNVSFGYLILLQNPESIRNAESMMTRKYAAAALLVLGLLLSIVTVLVHRWSVSQPAEQVRQFSSAIKALIRGDVAKFRKGFENTEFAPLVKDLDRVLVRLRRSKPETQSADPNIWTPARLRSTVLRLFGDSRLCVVANREPYIHNRKGKTIETVFPASGLVTAVEPIVRACSGLWIGHGSGTADRETADKKGVLLVPPDKHEYALKRVWLTKEEEEGYYYGFSNEGLWPLCHIAHTRPLFRSEDWNYYRQVNEKFSKAFQEEMKEENPIALIQDYHFALLPEMLRRERPDAVTSLFWHIPWPNPEAIRICPWREELLRGMLGADLIGFHIQYHCNNFLDTVDSFLEARVDRERFSVTINGHTCYVKPFPISVEWPAQHALPAEAIPATRAALFEELGIPPDGLMGLGVDRLDYTKGIIERLLGVEKMLDSHPELVGRFVFVQISAPSRVHIESYQRLDSDVRECVQRINHRFRRPGYEPVQLRISHHDAKTVFRYYSAADVVLVTSLHDGMNLVAKEYVASRTDLGGALVLSAFTGAAREMADAFIVNPYDTDQTADAIYKSLTMDSEERAQRMGRLRQGVASHNVYAWAGSFLEEVHRISELRKTGVA